MREGFALVVMFILIGLMIGVDFVAELDTKTTAPKGVCIPHKACT